MYRLGWVAVVVLVSVTSLYGQPRVELATVCEVLSSVKKYPGKPVAVIGRLDCTYNVIDTHCDLTEDRCDRPVVFKGETWPSKVWIQFVFPANPTFSAFIPDDEIRRKLSIIRKSTRLGLHKVMVLQNKNGVGAPSGWRDVPDEWGIAYGLLRTKRTFNFFGAPVALVVNGKDFRSFKDEDYP